MEEGLSRGRSESPESRWPLAESVKELLGVVSVRALARKICASVCDLLGSDAASFVLVDGERVYYAEEQAPRGMWKGRYFPITACISGWAVTHQQAAVIEDVYDDPRIPIEAYRPTEVRSMMMVPMVGNGEPVGSVGAYWHAEGASAEADLTVLQALADAASRALSAAEMLEECRRLRASWQGGEDEVEAGILPIVAHDLRTPLSAIATGLSVIETDELSERSAFAVTRMQRSVRRASRMVHQLMTYSEIERHGKVPLELTETRIDRVCEQMAGEAKTAHPEGDVDLSAEKIVGLWDGDRLSEAIGNLMVNGLQHSPDRRIVVRAWRSEDRALVSVHNDGEPIPSELRPQLFEPFRRAGERTRGSVGLGLFIADQIARAHGGEIDVTSTEAEGTTFTIAIPLAPLSLERSPRG